MKSIQFLFLIIILLFCCIACERVVPADQFFCKAEEVYVLKEPFKPETAIIVMYKGDDVFLLGDTVYLELPPKEGSDSVSFDSTTYYVKVKAKRGVIGWVNAAELQHELPKTPPAKPAAPVQQPIAAKQVEVDSLAVLDSLLNLPDSLNSPLLGTYSYAKDSSTHYALHLLTVDSNRWSFQWELKGSCDTLIVANASLKGRSLYGYTADSCFYQLKWLSEEVIKFDADSSCLDLNCFPHAKLLKTKTLEASDTSKTEKSDSINRDS